MDWKEAKEKKQHRCRVCDADDVDEVDNAALSSWKSDEIHRQTSSLSRNKSGMKRRLNKIWNLIKIAISFFFIALKFASFPRLSFNTETNKTNPKESERALKSVLNPRHSPPSPRSVCSPHSHYRIRMDGEKSKLFDVFPKFSWLFALPILTLALLNTEWIPMT